MIDVIAGFPSLQPQKHFDLSPPPAISTPWKAGTDNTGQNRLIRSYPVSTPSSPREGIVANLDDIWLCSPSSTSSETSIIELFSAILSTDKYVSSVSLHDPVDNLFELRNLTGFGWGELAKLLDVDRRTLHNWLKAGKIRDSNKFKISETLKVLRYADRGCANANANALKSSGKSGITPFSAITRGLYSDARSYMGRGKAHKLEVKESSVVFRKYNWALAEFAVHDIDEFDDSMTELPQEPRPISHPKKINRR